MGHAIRRITDTDRRRFPLSTRRCGSRAHCEERPEFVCSSAQKHYRKEEVTFDRMLCQRHASLFAKKFGLEVPDNVEQEA